MVHPENVHFSSTSVSSEKGQILKSMSDEQRDVPSNLLRFLRTYIPFGDTCQDNRMQMPKNIIVF